MQSICKLLVILFLLCASSFAKEAVLGGVTMKANEIYYDSKKDIITAIGNIFIQMDNYTLNADKV